MTLCRPRGAACALALAACLPLAHLPAQAVALSADGQWAEFYIDAMTAVDGGLGFIDTDTGVAQTFEFVVPVGSVGRLTVVDGGFAGDVFGLKVGAQTLGQTSMVSPVAGDSVGVDFDAALANGAYSRGVFTLQAGSYTLGGWLLQSARLQGTPLDATVGGIQLQVSPVPEPGQWLLLLAGLPLLGLSVRRRCQGGEQ